MNRYNKKLCILFIYFLIIIIIYYFKFLLLFLFYFTLTINDKRNLEVVTAFSDASVFHIDTHT